MSESPRSGEGSLRVDLAGLYERERAPMLHLACLLVGSRSIAEEIVQDAFVVVRERWAELENPGGYLRSTVVNGCRMALRRRATEHRYAYSDVATIDAPSELIELWSALDRLSDRGRAAIVLRYFVDLPDAEIAKLLGCRIATVRSIVYSIASHASQGAVMIELEDRLRADLPRLAELVALRPDEELPTLESRRRRSRGHQRALAVGVAICVLLGGVATVVARSRSAHAPASGPRVVVRDRWRSLPPSPLGPRANAVAVWTGHDVLVWGGYRGNATVPLALQNGAAYHPATNSWTRIVDNQWAHPGAVGVWANGRLFVLAKNGGAQYDPARNAWHDIARLPNVTGGGFRAAAWSGRTLFGVIAGPEVGTVAVARYDNRRNAWTIGTSLRTSSRPDGNNVSTVWTGKELVVSDGARAMWAYDPTTDRWRALAGLPRGAAATSIASIGGTLVAVYLADKGLYAARAVGNTWRTIADSPHARMTQPIAVDAGGRLVAIDRSGRGIPLRADATTGRWVSLDGYPLRSGVNGTAVWASTGLFVWGGLPRDTPASFPNPTPGKPDAAWYEP